MKKIQWFLPGLIGEAFAIALTFLLGDDPPAEAYILWGAVPVFIGYRLASHFWRRDDSY